jgi:antirestriction protein ArdC
VTAQEARALAEEGVQQLVGDPEEWRKWADTLARFPRYSPGNALLIRLQRPDATYVAGYAAWRRLGRQVEKGQHGLTILAPVVRRGPDAQRAEALEGDAGREPPDAAERRVVAFRAVTVFDVSQTKGRPLRLPEVQALRDDTLHDLADHLIRHAVGLPPVAVGAIGTANGLWDPATGRITLRPGLAPDQQLETLLHEWAHSVGVADSRAAAGRHRGQEEVAAETTAYVVARTLGLDTAAYSRGYVAEWSGLDPRQVARVAEEVGRRVHRITGALQQTQEQAPHPALAAAVARWQGPPGWAPEREPESEAVR